jgi:hypothetical protein
VQILEYDREGARGRDVLEHPEQQLEHPALT